MRFLATEIPKEWDCMEWIYDLFEDRGKNKAYIVNAEDEDEARRLVFTEKYKENKRKIGEKMEITGKGEILMSKILGFFDLKLSEKIGKMFEYASMEKHYEIQDFTDKWLLSDTYKAVLFWDVSLVSQCATYILDCFEKEMKEKGTSIKETTEEWLPLSCVNWIGYIFTYWCIRDGLTGECIRNDYQIKIIIRNAEIYHSMSVSTAISMIKEDAEKEK